MRDLRSGAQRSDVVIEFRNQWGKIPLAGASGAERNEIGAALRVAISCVQAESRGLRVSHVILDEIFANKAEIRMPQCQQMLRLFAEWAGRCFCVAHQPALAEVADDRIEVAGGVARVVGAREAVTA